MFAEHWAIFGKRKPRVWKLDFYWCCGGVAGVEVRFLLWAFCNYWVFSIWRDIPQLIWQHLHMIIYTTTNNAPKEWVFRSKSFKKKKNQQSFTWFNSTVPDSHFPEENPSIHFISAESLVSSPSTKPIHLSSTLAEQTAAQASLKMYLLLKLSLRLSREASKGTQFPPGCKTERNKENSLVFLKAWAMLSRLSLERLKLEASAPSAVWLQVRIKIIVEGEGKHQLQKTNALAFHGGGRLL